MSRRLLILSILSISLFSFTFSEEILMSVHQTNATIYDGLAAVGVSVGIEENKLSNLAQQIREKEAELDAREAALQSREQEEQPLIPLEWYVTAMAFMLLILVLLNFYLDWRREETV